MQEREHIDNAGVMGPVQARSRSHGPLRTFSVLLMGVFFVVLMMGLVAGVAMYRAIADAQSRAAEQDMRAGLVASCVHASDVYGALQRGQGPEGDALVLVDHVGGEDYETRIYQYDGMLVQEYALAGRPYNPGGANALLEVHDFSFTIDGGLITLVIDGSPLDLYVRSAQGDQKGGAV